ncbi:MAG: hypothetical protein ABSE15_09440 [Candidatus Bathyarchaeia archaeon]|jgi:hypothetical protein
MYFEAFKNMLRSRRFWVWGLCGAAIYAVPAAIRIATGNVILPVLSWAATPWIGMYVPANLVEKILVNAFFPGGAGAVAGEIFYSNAKSEALIGREKYLARLSGALLAVTVWSLIQLLGGLLDVAGSWGGNLFEYPSVFPLNYLLASLSIFTPTILGFLKNKIASAFGGGSGGSAGSVRLISKKAVNSRLLDVKLWRR